MNKKIFDKKYIIKMYDTDATGVIYFNQVHRLACDTFEEALAEKEIEIKEILERQMYAFPIVACSSQYFSPLYLSQRVQIELYLKNLGKKSFCLLSKFITHKGVTLASEVSITHACISSTTRSSCEVPTQLINFFK